MDSAAMTEVQTRVPISLRLPARIVATVNNYAAEQRISKTDAFLHFLQEGISAEGFAISGHRYDDLMEQILQIKALLMQEGGGQAGALDEIATAVSEVCADYPAIRQAYLFGSFARGEQTEKSDIDLRIELDRGLPFNLHDLSHFSKRIEQRTGRSVDVVSAERIKNKRLVEAIERDKVLVYEREA